MGPANLIRKPQIPRKNNRRRRYRRHNLRHSRPASFACRPLQLSKRLMPIATES
jgi:hypothetical protein